MNVIEEGFENVFFMAIQLWLSASTFGLQVWCEDDVKWIRNREQVEALLCPLDNALNSIRTRLLSTAKSCSNLDIMHFKQEPRLFGY